ncbi:Metal transporter Nramp2 [Chlorella vulgaris]
MATADQIPAKDSSSEIDVNRTSEPDCGSSDSPSQSLDHSWSWRQFATFCGSGLLMVAAFLDPGNLEADIQVGAKTGFALLWWVALVTLICGTSFQCLSGRLGLVTGKDLARHCGERWPRVTCWFLWVMLELAIVAVDIQETIGSAQALFMLSNGQIPLWAGCIIVSFSAFILLMLERFGTRLLEALFGSIIALMGVSMAVNFFRSGVPAKEVALGLFRPTLPAGSIGPAVGTLGALVMPYNFRPNPPTPGSLRGVLRYLRLETVMVLLLAFLINMCVICVFAQGFYGTDQEIGLLAAGDLLADKFGQEFKVFWAVGLLASGQASDCLAQRGAHLCIGKPLYRATAGPMWCALWLLQVSTIALTYAGQVVMSGLLMIDVKSWLRMIGTRLFALVPALTVALVSQTNNSFDRLNQMLNVVQSVLLPFAIIPLIHMAGNREVMGPPGAFATACWLNSFCSMVAVALAAINGYFLVTFRQENLPDGTGVMVGWGFLMAAYYCAIACIAIGPERLDLWTTPYLHRARGSVKKASCATVRVAGGVAVWVKGINWRDPESLLEVHI